MPEQHPEKAYILPIYAEDRGERLSDYSGICPGCSARVSTQRSGWAPGVCSASCPGCSSPLTITKGGL